MGIVLNFVCVNWFLRFHCFYDFVFKKSWIYLTEFSMMNHAIAVLKNKLCSFCFVMSEIKKNESKRKNK